MNINKYLTSVQFAESATREQLKEIIKKHIEYCGNEETAMDIMKIIKIGRGKYVYYYTC